MSSTLILQANSVEQTQQIANQLPKTLYSTTRYITLQGNVGAGKTTFTQALAKSLGVTQVVQSPTYALASEYACSLGTLTHVDLYRLTPAAAQEFWEQQEFATGLVIVEWPERLQTPFAEAVNITLQENSPTSRTMELQFTEEEQLPVQTIQALYEEYELPVAIQHHCALVAAIAHYFGTLLVAKNVPVRLNTLYQACLLHDAFRFLDFDPKYAPKNSPHTSVNDNPAWQKLREKYPNQSHGKAAANFAREHGNRIVGAIIEPHEFWQFPTTIEQQLLFYADKRSVGNQLHSVKSRMEDICTRYTDLAAKHDPQALLKDILEFEQFKDTDIANITTEMVAAHAVQHGLLPWGQPE